MASGWNYAQWLLDPANAGLRALTGAKSDVGAADIFNPLAGTGNAIQEGITDSFQATPAQLQQAQFADAIRRAQEQALAGNAQGNATAAQQAQFADYLRGVMNGSGPSLARMQLDDALEQNTKGAASAIASQRGINPALAQRLVLNRQAGMNQQAAFDASRLRAQEQFGAAGMLGQALGQQRAQDIGQQQANTSLFGTAAQGQQGQNAVNVQNQLGAQQINADVAKSNTQARTQLVGGLLGGAGQAGSMAATAMLAHGGPVPGRAPVSGDSPQNDTVPAMLSPGEIVLPRSVAQADDAPERAAAFVDALRKQKGNPAAQGYGAVLAKARELDERMRRLESAYGVAR